MGDKPKTDPALLAERRKVRELTKHLTYLTGVVNGYIDELERGAAPGLHGDGRQDPEVAGPMIEAPTTTPASTPPSSDRPIGIFRQSYPSRPI